MGKVDIATKQYMSHRDVIADAFNFYIYDGRQVIKPEKLQKIDTAEIFLPYGNDADIAVQKMRDNLMLWSMAMDNEAVYVVLGIENQELLSYIPDYRINLIEPAKISDEDYDKFKTDLGSIMQFIKHQSDKDGSWIKGKQRFNHVEKEAVELINLITGSKIVGDEKEEVVDMCRAWENSINNAKSEGKSEGRIEGKIETLYEECDMSIPDIAKKVSKPEEYVKEVIKKLTAACL